MPYSPVPAFVAVNPSNPTAISSATYLMNGLGVAGASAFTITPTATGRVLILVTGDIVENATAQTATLQLSYGTGAAPANAAAVAGTQVGQQVAWVSLTGTLTSTFTLMALVTGLTVPTFTGQGVQSASTPYWLDVNSKSSAGTVQLTNLSCVAVEL